ncbi:TPA: DUF4145 domain-containing protein [Raoultella ornithinolytica]|uniref:DUF4145 domain-containing protein n=1 Tax=Raoultella ornithinolytica TaxID=54291 RepID=UPI0015DC2CF9|nr:DUF4145 domain-containing protein [Raoultella ornithinolytica]EJD6650818.1 DUF4145 domain-containing protein [Raoultella ornithinolytica]ELV3661490.1 DUF4145 domain-containing protein [Raoultella ornithinolytica]MEB7958255.1 DUF4145 domain-containing protein [Raoultella ornithinolytica]BBJ86484.1 hypothetical protein ROGSH02058M1_026830 [Raoultella ornithinolytica]BBT85430.1 hypothetical protein WP8W19C01_26710 [Raoultella ornithinolytica]
MSALVDLVSVLIWPGVTVWFIKKYGDDVKALILRLSRIKMGGAEAEFAANLGVAEALAVDTPAINIQDAVNNEDTEFSRRLSTLQRIADVSPRAAIMESWLLVEEAAGKAGFVQGATTPRVNLPLFLDWLVRDNKISKNTAKLVEKMRHLRNSAAHLKDFELTRDEAERYLKLAAQLSLIIVEPEDDLENRD